MKNIVKSLAVVAVLCGLAPFAFAQKKAKQEAKKDNTVVFWFTRHGKTILNTMDRVQGWSDAALTPAGVEVAEYLGAGLKAEGVKFETAYSSDLGRARWTARIVLDGVGQPDLPINETDKIRETNFGSYEGETNFRQEWHHQDGQDRRANFYPQLRLFPLPAMPVHDALKYGAGEESAALPMFFVQS